jgi:hypothetical protein
MISAKRQKQTEAVNIKTIPAVMERWDSEVASYVSQILYESFKGIFKIMNE